jgi:hypothetical protein
MDLRRYELATFAAAKRLRSSYCTLAHGSVLLDKFISPDDLRAVVGARDAGALESVDAAVIEFADKLALDASSVTPADVDRLRALGLTDTEIVDVVLAAAVRCFSARSQTALRSRPTPGTHNSTPSSRRPYSRASDRRALTRYRFARRPAPPSRGWSASRVTGRRVYFAP